MRIAYIPQEARTLCRALSVPVYQAQDDIIQEPKPRDKKQAREMMSKGEGNTSPTSKEMTK